MTVHDQTDTKEAIENGVIGAARRKRGNSEGNKTSREKAFECPMVGTVRLRRRGEGSRVVYGAPVDGYVLVEQTRRIQ